MKLNFENKNNNNITILEQYIGNDFRDKLMEAYNLEKERGNDFSGIKNKNQILVFIKNALNINNGFALTRQQAGYLISETLLLLRFCKNSDTKECTEKRQVAFSKEEIEKMKIDSQKMIKDEDERTGGIGLN
ncbi:hypothetical protein KAI92_03795 [Candidatus Parcubacteria bacterium]|nr:hypothetical protein [Candidatus Parcubacteria bacterium]